MASLPKPLSCDCGISEFRHEFHPERWICKACGRIAAERSPKQKIPDLCVTCKVVPPFGKGSNRCRECRKKYNAQYREKNKEKIKKQHRESYQRDKPKRQASSRNSEQRSPEAFLTMLIRHLTANYKDGKSPGKARPKVVEIDDQFVIDMWNQQKGRCALSGVPMVHVYNDIRTISIDRIENDKDYIPSNVQLVCKFVNLGKSKHTNADVTKFFDAFRAYNKVQEALNSVWPSAILAEAERIKENAR